MSQPASNDNGPSKLNKLLTGNVDQKIKARLPRGTGSPAPVSAPAVKPVAAPAPAPVSAETPSGAPVVVTRKTYGNRFLPIFWTVASVISLLVNVGLLIALLVVIQVLGGTRAALDLVQGQATGLLGGLYHNFVKMDAAHIRTNIFVSKEIPVNFVLNVSGPTDVVLTSDVSISGALVTVNTGGLNINNARANIVLPAGTVLPVSISNLVVPVNQSVLAELNVPVDIPLNQTELHEPFVGLQKVVEPYFCMLQPNTIINNVNVCENAAPVLPFLAPAGTPAP